MSDLLTERDLKTERATEPPKRWRIKMQAKEELVLRDYVYQEGEFFQVGPHYPSKDAAESAAMDFLSHALDPPRDHEILANVAEYIGAFPDGEAP